MEFKKSSDQNGNNGSDEQQQQSDVLKTNSSYFSSFEQQQQQTSSLFGTNINKSNEALPLSNKPNSIFGSQNSGFQTNNAFGLQQNTTTQPNLPQSSGSLYSTSDSTLFSNQFSNPSETSTDRGFYSSKSNPRPNTFGGPFSFPTSNSSSVNPPSLPTGSSMFSTNPSGNSNSSNPPTGSGIFSTNPPPSFSLYNNSGDKTTRPQTFTSTITTIPNQFGAASTSSSNPSVPKTISNLYEAPLTTTTSNLFALAGGNAKNNQPETAGSDAMELLSELASQQSGDQQKNPIKQNQSFLSNNSASARQSQPQQFALSSQSILPPQATSALPSDNSQSFISDDQSSSFSSTTAPEFYLEDAPIPPEGIPTWSKSNRTLKFTLSSVSDEGIAWIDRREQKIDMPLLPEEQKLYPALIPSSLKFSPGYSHFVSESYSIVKECQQAIEADNNSTTSTNVICRNYLQKFIETIESSLYQIHDSTALADAMNIAICFLVVQFGTTTTNNNVEESFSSALSGWANRVDPGFSDDDTAEIMKTIPPTNHPLFWNLVHDKASRGLLEVCAAMLREAYSKDLDSDVLECIDYATQLLRSYPDQEGSQGYKFPQWRNACLNAYEKADEIADSKFRIELTRLFGIMKGDKAIILEANSSNWIVALTALVKFHDPSRSRLKEYFDFVSREIPVDSTLEWESGCAAVISGDILVAITKIESLDICIATTVAELCQMRGLLDDYINIADDDAIVPSVRDWLVLTHAQGCLASHIPELARTGIYMLLDLDTPQARETIAEYLPRHDFESIEELDWVIGIANQLELYDTEREIHRIAARNYLQTGCYVEAFVALDRAQDIPSLQAYSWQLFENTIIMNNAAACSDTVTVEAIQPNSGIELPPVVKEIIAPFAVLAHFLQYRDEGRHSEAASQIIALFKFPYLPSKYLGPLICMTIPMLSRKKPRVFTTSEVIIIMNALDMWEHQQSELQQPQVQQVQKPKQRQPQQDEEGLHILLKALDEVGDSHDNDDWRRLLIGVSKDNLNQHIVKIARVALAHEISRTYLAGV